MNYARRQQYRRLSKAAVAGTASAGAVLLAVASAGAISAAGVLLVLSLGFGLYARHWLALAGRMPGRCSLRGRGSASAAVLELEGWRLRHSIPWRGRGDIDSLAIAPTGPGFAIETKTRTYEDWHLVRVREQAAWLSRRRRRWCRRGAVPVVCLVRPRGVERVERGVLVVSIDRLIPLLRSSVGWLGRPVDEPGMRGLSGQRGRL